MIYADTSALVKRYLEEPFSAEFDTLLQQGAMAISRLTVVELRCALARRRHIGESTQPPRIAPARGPPLWEAAAAAEQAKNDLQWDSSAHSAPEIEFDQRIAW